MESASKERAEDRDRAPSADQSELDRRRLVEAVRKDVVAELKYRYAWMGIVAALATSGVLSAAIWAALADARVQLESSQRVNDLLSERLAHAVNEAEQLRSQSVLLIKDFQEAENRAAAKMDDVSARAEELAHKVSTAERSNLVISDDLQRQVTQLSDVLERLIAPATDPGTDPTGKLAMISLLATIQEVELSSDRTSKSIEAAIKRSEFVKYPVYVRRLPGSIALEQDLRNQGFRVHDLGPPPPGVVPASYGAIRIGGDVPKEVAATVLRTAKFRLPFLRYVEEGDRPQEIDIGFPEEGLRERGYRAWSAEDFDSVDQLDDERFWLLLQGRQ